MKSNLLNEIADFAEEVQILRKQGKATEAYMLIKNIYPKISRYSTEFWRRQYYINGKGGNPHPPETDNPEKRIYECIEKVKSKLGVALTSGQFFNDIPEEIAKNAEGSFKYNK